MDLTFIRGAILIAMLCRFYRHVDLGLEQEA